LLKESFMKQQNAEPAAKKPPEVEPEKVTEKEVAEKAAEAPKIPSKQAQAPKEAPKISLQPQQEARKNLYQTHRKGTGKRAKTELEKGMAIDRSNVGSGKRAKRNMKSKGMAKTGQRTAEENTGRWTAEEHNRFLQGLQQHRKDWHLIGTLVKTRSTEQVRTHAQKYLLKNNLDDCPTSTCKPPSSGNLPFPPKNSDKSMVDAPVESMDCTPKSIMQLSLADIDNLHDYIHGLSFIHPDADLGTVSITGHGTYKRQPVTFYSTGLLQEEYSSTWEVVQWLQKQQNAPSMDIMLLPSPHKAPPAPTYPFIKDAPERKTWHFASQIDSHGPEHKPLAWL